VHIEMMIIIKRMLISSFDIKTVMLVVIKINNGGC